MRSALRSEIAWRSSSRTTVKEEAAKPCVRAFWAERDLPSEVRGPELLAALARLAACCFSEMGTKLSFRFRHSMGRKLIRRIFRLCGGGKRRYIFALVVIVREIICGQGANGLESRGSLGHARGSVMLGIRGAVAVWDAEVGLRWRLRVPRGTPWAVASVCGSDQAIVPRSGLLT